VHFFDGRFCIGIHRRVDNALVADLQSDGKVPSLEMFIRAVEVILSILTKEGISENAIFLATDDAEAVGEFKRAFGSRLIVRDNVQRTTSDAAEVDVLVHASSSVSTVASIMNPALTLVRL